MAAEWKRGWDRQRVLGREGLALSDVREFTRSCLVVGVRGWGRTESGEGEWLEIVRSRLGELGYPVVG